MSRRTYYHFKTPESVNDRDIVALSLCEENNTHHTKPDIQHPGATPKLLLKALPTYHRIPQKLLRKLLPLSSTKPIQNVVNLPNRASTAKHSVELALLEVNIAKQNANEFLGREQQVPSHLEKGIEIPSNEEQNILNKQRNQIDEERRKIKRLERTLEARYVTVERLEWQMGNAG